MAIPVSIEKVKLCTDNPDVQDTEFLFKINERSKWEKIYRCDIYELTRLRDEINEIIKNTSISEELGISLEEADEIEYHNRTDELCKDCDQKQSYTCKICLFELQSPLERKLYLALSNEYIKFYHQYPLSWKGENIPLKGRSYYNKNNNFKDVLTVVDFYIKNGRAKLCIYVDGHTYHERTAEQAQRDKRIDRKLQELGFTVLRYPGKDVNENLNGIISEIKKWIN